jgi:CRP/FNR family transcriptional regulator, cyclic AMP receptor protein
VKTGISKPTLTIQEVLTELSPFNVLGRANLGELAKVCRAEWVPAAHVLIRQGEQLGYLVSVVDGTGRMQRTAPDKKTIIESPIGKGNVIGLLSALDQKPISATIIAETPMQLLLVPIAVVKQLMREVPVFAEQITIQLTTMVRRLEEERLMLSLPNAFQRIYAHLNQLLSSESATPDTTVLPKQNEIAAYVNVSRETVSRAIQLLVKKGVIAKQGHLIKVQKADKLKSLAETGPEAISGGEQL